MFPNTEQTLRDLHFKWLKISYQSNAPSWAAAMAARYESDLRELAAAEQRLTEDK